MQITDEEYSLYLKLKATVRKYIKIDHNLYHLNNGVNIATDLNTTLNELKECLTNLDNYKDNGNTL